MKTALLFSLCIAFIVGCFGGSFQVTGPVEADTTSYSIVLPYVPDYTQMDSPPYDNITDYYVHLEYNANIVNPIGLFVTSVQDQPFINGSTVLIPAQPFGTNDDEFGVDAIGFPTITPIAGLPDIVVEIAPAINAVQGTQITLIVTIENLGNRRPQTPTVEFILPGDFVDLIGASSNRPNVTINITEIGGDYYFVIAWPGAILDGAASDVDITIDLFVHADACEAYANANTRREARYVDDEKLTRQQSSVASSSSVDSSDNSTGNSSSSVNCPAPGFIDDGNVDPACRPQPDCPDELTLPTGACGGFCVQGVVFPDYLNPAPGKKRAHWVHQRNFVDKLTDDPTVNGTANPTITYFFAILPGGSSSLFNDGGEDSSSLNLVIILLPLFLGLLCLCCVAILIAALLAALWWFLTGREKMRTRVQWIPGRNKGGEDDGL